MKISAEYQIPKGLARCLLLGLLSLSANLQATTFATMTSSIFNSNSSVACNECHLSTLAGVNRHAAPLNSDFDIYLEAATRASTIHDYVSLAAPSGYMPMDPNAVDFTDAANLNAGERAIVADWLNDGAPFAAAAVTTSSAIIITKTSATLRASVNPNTHSATTVPGTAFFNFGLTTSYGSTTPVITGLTGTGSITRSTAISGLNCGTTYHFRGRATNGHSASAVVGSNSSFTTSSCTNPVMAGVSIAVNATNQNAVEDVNADYALTITDDDPGALNWSKTNGNNGGAVTLISPTSTSLNGSATVRYRSAANYFGADTFTVTVTNAVTSTSRTLTFNMTVSDDGSDAPVISGAITMNENEDGVNAADGALTPIAVSVSAVDPDNSPSYHWDVTASNDGAPNFSVATGVNPTLSYTPLANDNGTPADSFTIRVCDGGFAGTGLCDSQIITVNLASQPDTPTAVGEASGIVVLEGEVNALITVIGNDTDPDAGDAAALIPVNVTVTSGNIMAVSVVGQQIQLTHGGAEELSASVTYQVRDAARTSVNTVTAVISITGTDDPPTSSSFTDSSAVDEGTNSAIDVVAQSNDPESASMAVCDTLTAPTSGNATVLRITSGPDIGKVLYTHNGSDVAGGGETDTFTYQVNDANDPSCASGNNSSFATVTVNLTHVNDAPLAVADAIIVAEGATVTGLLGGNSSVLQNDTDEENGTGIGFTVNGNSAPGFNTAFSLNSDGTFSYSHDGSENFSTGFSYTVNDGDDDSASPATVSITVTPVNDAPGISTTVPTPAMVFTEQVAANIYQVSQSDVDDVAFTYSLGVTGLAGDTPAGDMTVSAGGLISWTPPRSGNFMQATAMVTVTVSDVDASTAGANIQSDVQMFSVSTSPLDTDSDGVADYSDNCPNIANAGQQDLDNDTVRLLPQTDPSGLPADGDVDPTATDVANVLSESYLKGGDACDEDADGDGMSNIFENMFAFLNPLNAADATADEDGDGISNLDEFLASTAPDTDSVGPIVTAPTDITVNATGLLTVVALGEVSGNDGDEGGVTLFKAAVNLTTTELAALDNPATGCTVLSNYETDLEPFRPGKHIVTWATCDSVGNSGRDNQTVNVKPLVSINAGQSVGEGQPVTISVVLNGDAIAYPATVDYTVTGTALAFDDHDAVATTVSFNAPGEIAVISFNTLADAVSESNETVVITLHTPVNVALSNSKSHTVTITEANIAPKAVLLVTQPTAALDINKGNTLYLSDGIATVVANASDGNGDTLNYDWSASDANLLAAATISNGQIDFDPAALVLDRFYKVSVAVSDGQVSITVDRLLLVKATETNSWLIGQDDDGDGRDNLSEGYGDEDGDGIPNYLDDLSTPANAIETHTVNLETSVLLETNPGLRIALGETAVAASASGVLISLQNIVEHGGAGGSAVSNAATEYTHLSGLMNFEISGLNESIVSVNVVIPLQSAIQVDAVYRKYNSSGWFDFVIDDLNQLHSADGSDGTCPQPGSKLYSVGLTVGHQCLQLTIQDGGANDADGMRNFVVKDPGGLALAPKQEAVADTAAAQANGRIGSISLWFMLTLLAALMAIWRMRVLQNVQVRRK